MADPLKLGVLISGSGSNLQSIIDHIEKGSLNAIIKIVISNNPDAYGIIRAKKHGLPILVFKHEDFKTREDFDLELIQALQNNHVQLIVLAGFMRILTPAFLRAFPQRIINIHPALLPAFPGTHVQKQALEYGVKFSGCTVHFVDEGVDTGPIIIQSVLPVLDDDTEETLAARILKEEHRIYPQAIQFYADGKIEINGRKVKIKSANANKTSFPALHNPPLAGD
jgi:phosphoribosylglycinamide formyltransferase-1